MATSITNEGYKINGVISTDKTVVDNMNTLCTAAGAWATFDVHTGKWSVIINQAGTSTASFNDSNIIGGITVSGSGINELYNAVTIEFPHADLRDQRDYIDLEIPTIDWYPNELPNRLNISIDCINNPVQAQMIAARELKQSRVNTLIEFTTDFSRLELKAGDLIDVTASMYSYTNKVFRIIKVVEDDTNDGQLVFNITALEYDANVYSMTGLVRKERNKKTGIVPKAQNTAIQTSDAIATAQQAATGFADPSAATALLALANSLTASGGVGSASNLDGLTDVTVATPTTGQALVYNGTQWVNSIVSGTGAGSGSVYTLASGTVLGGLHLQSNTELYQLTSIPITISSPGTYVLQATIDQATGGAAGRDTDWVAYRMDISTSSTATTYPNFGTVIDSAISGGNGVWYWTDFALSFEFTITAPYTGYVRFFSYIPTDAPEVYGSGTVTNTAGSTRADVYYSLTQNISAGGAVLDTLSDVVISAPSSGQVLKYNGTNWVNDTDATGGGGSGTAYTPTYQEITSSTTWTKPTGATLVKVEVIGGGAGGGSGGTNVIGTSRTGGGGGSGGAYHERTFLASALSSTVAITVGAGGAGGAAITANTAAGNTGTAGGETLFGSYLFTGTAGAGAGGNTGSGVSSASGGIISYKGSSGQNGGSGGAGGLIGGTSGTSATIDGGAGGGGGAGAGTFSGTDSTGTIGGAGGINRISASAAAVTPAAGIVGAAGVHAGQGGNGGGFPGSNIAGQNGGTGAAPGGGGGGGSASTNGYTSGAGGAGAAGVVRIWTW